MEEIEIVRLVRESQAGDRESFGRLVQQLGRMVFGIVLRRLRNQTEAAEVTQDVFVQMLRKLHQLREPERFVGWLKRIAVRLSINRAVRRPKEVSAAEDGFSGISHGIDTPLETVLRGEQSGQVWDGLQQLRSLDRDTLLAFYFEGQSLQEMSASFSSPVGTIKRRLHTARNRLKDQLLKLQPVG